MPGVLGILVTSDRHFDHVVKLTETAFNKGKEVKIFFTGSGVKLLVSPEFKRLCGIASIGVCDWSLLAYGLTGDEIDIGSCINITQAKHAEIIKNCDRYLVF